MSENYEEQLIQKYPQLFPKDSDGNPCQPQCGIWCPDGWEAIVERLCAQIASALKQHDPQPSFTIDQVKEKFAGLRFYFSCDESFRDEADRLVRVAEEECSKTCQNTGTPAELSRRGGWFATISPDEQKKNGFESIKH